MARSEWEACIGCRELGLLCLLVMQVVTAPFAQADSAVVRGADGIQGSLMDLGEGTILYRTPHGTLAPMGEGPGGVQGHTLTPDALEPGLRTPFGTPRPPSALTPAPVLPFAPHGTPMPQQSSPPQIPPPGSGTRSGSSGFRGR